MHNDEWTHLAYAKTITEGGMQGAFSHSEKAGDKVLSLPVYPDITQEQVEHVSADICEFVRKWKQTLRGTGLR